MPWASECWEVTAATELSEGPQPALRSKIRTVIVDDELPARQRLHDLLAREADVEVVCEFARASAASREIPDVRPDLIFVDAGMPERSGFELLAGFRGLDPEPAAVVVTASDEYAVRAFDAGAIDYLLKPVEIDRFALTMKRVREWKELAPGNSPFRAMRREMPPPAAVAVKLTNGFRLLRLKEIDWIEVADNYIRLHVGPASFLHRDTMSHFEATLGPHFARINRRTIVNFERIVFVQRSGGRDHLLVLRDGTRLILHHAYRSRLTPYVSGLF
jgi:two-component system LytT family response regulator